jgi:hypothetical protein
MLMGLPVLSSVLMVLFQYSSVWICISFAIVMIVYLALYRKVALLQPLVATRRKKVRVSA